MNLTSMQIIRALENEELTVPVVTTMLNSYADINVTNDDIRAIISGKDAGELEPYLRLVLKLNPPEGFRPKQKKIDHQKELKRRLSALDNAEVFLRDNKLAISRIIRLLGGFEVVAGVCGKSIEAVKGWENLVTIDGIKGRVPANNKKAIFDYAKRIKVKLSREDWSLVKPCKSDKIIKKKASKYIGVYKNNGHWSSAIIIDNRKKHIGNHSTEEAAALAYNEVAAPLGKRLNEVGHG